MEKERVVSRLRRAALLAAAAALAGGLFLSCSDGGGDDGLSTPQEASIVQKIVPTGEDIEEALAQGYHNDLCFYSDRTWNLYVGDPGTGPVEYVRGTYTGNPCVAGTVTLYLTQFWYGDGDDIRDGSWTDAPAGFASHNVQLESGDGGTLVLDEDGFEALFDWIDGLYPDDEEDKE